MSKTENIQHKKKAPSSPPLAKKKLKVETYPPESNSSGDEEYDHIDLYTDGSCLGNGKDKAPGGWACLTRYFSKKKFMCEVLKSGNALGTTNNRMEITAVISGLNPLKRMSLPVSISIFTDSKYTLNGATDWINKWKKNGWRTGKNEVKNKDLWEELDILVSLHKPKWKWVKAHSKTSDGWQHNHTVDEEARKQATLIK